MVAGGQARSGDVLLLSATLIALGLALFIVFHAYRGYRRNDSPRMLYLAAGLCLLTVVPLSLWIAVTSLGQAVALDSRIRAFYLPIAVRGSEIVGLLALLYSLLVSPARSE